MNRENQINDAADSIPANAVSVYGQTDAMDDFPVLKAFQQYIDAEQAKAQKRMTTLCIFFVSGAVTFVLKKIPLVRDLL